MEDIFYSTDYQLYILDPSYKTTGNSGSYQTHPWISVICKKKGPL